jgi:hypothetical protein
MLRYWKRKVEESFWDWYSKEKKWCEDQGKEPHRRNFEAGLVAIQHAKDASWWEWDRGSAPFF